LFNQNQGGEKGGEGGRGRDFLIPEDPKEKGGKNKHTFFFFFFFFWGRNIEAVLGVKEKGEPFIPFPSRLKDGKGGVDLRKKGK